MLVNDSEKLGGRILREQEASLVEDWNVDGQVDLRAGRAAKSDSWIRKCPPFIGPVTFKFKKFL